MARSRGIPAVVGLRDLAANVKEGNPVLVDGYSGEVIVRPNVDDTRQFRVRQAKREKLARTIPVVSRKPAVTLDHREVTLLANIDMPADAVEAWEAGAEGIGLYRTEFIFMNRDSFPSEDEQ